MTEQVEGYRLSPQQAHLYQRQERLGRPLLAQAVLTLTGALEQAALQAAVRAAVARHSILRTRFVRPPAIKLPLQVISGEAAFDWRVLDRADLERAARPADPDSRPADSGPDGSCAEQRLLDALLEDERARPRDPALRAALVSLTPTRHLLALTLPALCADTRTLHNLAAEVGAAYATALRPEEAAADDADGDAADEAVQYIQFSEWQNEVLADEEAALGRDFWRRQEAKGAPAATLPFAAALTSSSDDAAAATALGGSERARVRVELPGGVSGLAESLGCGEEVVLLSCWQVVVSRLVGAAPVLSVTHAGRKYDELRPALGLFARALPLPASVAAGQNFAGLAQAVRAQMEEAAQWQEYFVPGDGGGVSGGAQAQGGGIGFEYEARPEAVTAGGVEFGIAAAAVEGAEAGVQSRFVRSGAALWCEVE